MNEFPAEIFTSEKSGNDDAGDGTEGNPFKTIFQAMRHAGKEPFPVIYVDAKDDSKVSATCYKTSKLLVSKQTFNLLRSSSQLPNHS
jgi:hypothetical protein